MIPVTCPTCGHAFGVHDVPLDAITQCPNCKLSLRVKDNIALRGAPEWPPLEDAVNPANAQPVQQTRSRATTQRARRPQMPLSAAGVIAIVILLILCYGLSRTTNRRTQTSPAPGFRSSTERSSTSTKKWYEGGTLQSKSAIEWQAASSADKLATCADFVAKMWQNGDLKDSIADNISTVDDIRPYAQELVDFLDAAFKRDPDPEQNRILFSNQTVSSTAATGMVMLGWTK